MPPNAPEIEYSGPELCKLTASEAVRLLRNREIKPTELLQASLTRIEQVESDVNAVVTVCADRAREKIAKLELLNADGHGNPGWLAGLPIGIKDLTNVSRCQDHIRNEGIKGFHRQGK